MVLPTTGIGNRGGGRWAQSQICQVRNACGNPSWSCLVNRESVVLELREKKNRVRIQTWKGYKCSMNLTCSVYNLLVISLDTWTLQKDISGDTGKPAAIESHVGVPNCSPCSRPYGMRHSFLFRSPILTYNVPSEYSRLESYWSPTVMWVIPR